MIIELLQILILSLQATNTHHNTRAKNSLYRQPPRDVNDFTFNFNPAVFVVLCILALLLFVLLIFLFVPPMDSGLVYNNHGVI